MAKNANLHNAKKVKNNEFYTQLYDVAKELICYKNHCRNNKNRCKTILA